jgi:TolB protein
LSLGTAVEQLVADAGIDIDPVVTPDGKSLLYASSRSGMLELWLRPLVGGATYQITSSVNGSADRKPSMSPDGKTIVFTSDRVGDVRNIWSLDLGTRSLAQLTSYPDDAAGPSFAPDGSGASLAEGSIARGHPTGSGSCSPGALERVPIARARTIFG